MLNDKHSLEYEKLKYKYGKESLAQYIEMLKKGFFTPLSIEDNSGNPICYISSKIQIPAQKLKAFMQKYDEKIGKISMEDEIISTLSIENINSSRDSVRDILKGYAPKNDDDKKAYGIKLGLDFISDTSNSITEENLYKLYMLSCGEYVDETDRLQQGKKYRDDKVFVVGRKVDADILHEGAEFDTLSEKVTRLINFINCDNDIDDITKSIITHYYLAYLHPYFDGNGRTTRLLQMWVLIQKGYSASLYLPFSKYINEKKDKYYKVFEVIADNLNLSGVLDITPFVKFFAENVIEHIGKNYNNEDLIKKFENLISSGLITVKERELFYFVLANYGKNDFSTKELEKDFSNVAYATVRSFCLKLEAQNILSCTKYGNRVRYKLNI